MFVVRHRIGKILNNARLTDYSGVDAEGVPQHIADKGLYVDNLDAIRDEIGGSSYVIAEVWWRRRLSEHRLNT